MKVSINWLNELVALNIPVEELVNLLPLRSISTKEVTENFIELDMKGYNRADLLYMRGVAQEVAAITESQRLFKEPQEAEFVWNQKTLPNIKVEVKNPELSPLYCIAKIEGLSVRPSSEDWVKKLQDSGLRSINNVADITNLVMLEYGQPLHAFDLSKVTNEQIIVSTASAQEELITLDGKKRKLNADDLLITDPEKPLGVAGVMGGRNSEVSENTTSILLEAAIFDPIQIRKTATRLGLQSEAAKRFQHGLTKTRLLQALDVAIKMYEQIGGKVTGISINGNFQDKKRSIYLNRIRLNELVGVDITQAQVRDYLQALGFHLRGVSTNAWEVEIPYWRQDIVIEADLIEEVARMYGYENIPSQEVSPSKPLQEEDPIFQKISDLKSKLIASGLTEVSTYSFCSLDVLNNLEWDKVNLVKLANPISSETEYLREDIWPNLLEVVAKNIKQGFTDIAIFEIGKVFEMSKDESPNESYRLSIALMNDSDNPITELNQIFQSLGSNLEGCIVDSTGKRGMYENKYFHPTRFAFLQKNGEPIGGIAEVHKRFTDKFGIEKRVAVLEIELN